jgi:Fungal specific transcription factor domain
MTVERVYPPSKYGNLTPWYIGANQRIYNQLEQLHLSVFCCRQAATLRTFTRVMSDAKWLEMIPKAMESSEAVTYAVRANAANYMAKAAGAIKIPYQACTEYASALKFLQRDLYHPVKQTNDETLFAVLLLGVFDVMNCNIYILMKLGSKFYSVESSSRWGM